MRYPTQSDQEASKVQRYSIVVQSVLRTFFPAHPITSKLDGVLQPNDEKVNVEFEVAGMVGLSWPEVSIEQARGTVDALWELEASRFNSVLPAYVKFLGDPVRADAMGPELAAILIHRARERKKHSSRPDLTPDQAVAIGLLFAAFSRLPANRETDSYTSFVEVADIYLVNGMPIHPLSEVRTSVMSVQRPSKRPEGSLGV